MKSPSSPGWTTPPDIFNECGTKNIECVQQLIATHSMVLEYAHRQLIALKDLNYVKNEGATISSGTHKISSSNIYYWKAKRQEFTVVYVTQSNFGNLVRLWCPHFPHFLHM